MRTVGSYRRAMRFGLALWLVLGAFFTVSAADSTTNIPAAPLLPGSPKAPSSVDVSRLLFSPGVGDVVKMVSAGLDPGVIKAYIEQSHVSYNPTAQEIIVLKKLGVTNDIVMTMLAHRPRPAERPQPWLPVRPGDEPPQPEQTPAGPGLPWSALTSPYPINPYAESAPVAPYLPPFTGFGPLSSFNNSFPTFVNGQSVYAGYYLPTFPVFW